MNDMMTRNTAVALVRAELERAVEKWGTFKSLNEGLSVLYEEFDELWDEIRANKGREFAAMAEVVQVGAMALKCLGPKFDERVNHKELLEIHSPHHAHGMMRVAMHDLFSNGPGSIGVVLLHVANLAISYLTAFFTEELGMEMLEGRRHRV